MNGDARWLDRGERLHHLATATLQLTCGDGALQCQQGIIELQFGGLICQHTQAFQDTCDGSNKVGRQKILVLHHDASSNLAAIVIHDLVISRLCYAKIRSFWQHKKVIDPIQWLVETEVKPATHAAFAAAGRTTGHE